MCLFPISKNPLSKTLYDVISDSVLFYQVRAVFPCSTLAVGPVGALDFGFVLMVIVSEKSLISHSEKRHNYGESPISSLFWLISDIVIDLPPTFRPSKSLANDWVSP